MAKIDYLQVRFKLIDPINGSKQEVVFDHVKTIRFSNANLPGRLIITVPQGTLRLLPEWLVSICPTRKECYNAHLGMSFNSEAYDASFSFETTMIDDLNIRIISGGKK